MYGICTIIPALVGEWTVAAFAERTQPHGFLSFHFFFDQACGNLAAADTLPEETTSFTHSEDCSTEYLPMYIQKVKSCGRIFTCGCSHLGRGRVVRGQRRWRHSVRGQPTPRDGHGVSGGGGGGGVSLLEDHRLRRRHRRRLRGCNKYGSRAAG